MMTPRWLAVALLPPVGFLGVVKVGSLVFAKVVAIGDVLLPALGIVAVVATALAMGVLRKRLTKGGGLSPADA
jgi:hypothetical protein